MHLIDAVQLKENTRLALVGAGGKTTALFRLAEQWVASTEKSILLTTSTHLAEVEAASADHHIVVRQQADLDIFHPALPQGVVLLSGPSIENSRVAGLPEEILEKINQIADDHQVPLLIEADGSAQRPLKAPADYEPVIPDFVDAVIVVVGMSAVGRRLDQNWVHRVELFSSLTGLGENSKITVQSISKMLLSPVGGLKDIPAGVRKIVLFNQCEGAQAAGAAKAITRRLLQTYEQVIIASLKTKSSQEVISSNFPVAGIVLAAGGSQRLGQPKQLLDWQGQPFVTAVVKTAQAAGLSPVYVVVGASASEVESALTGLEVEIFRNPDWESGQASSLRIGIENLPPEIQAAVVLLVDQPQIPPTLIEALIAEHAIQNAPIVAPMIDHRRGNPVLFDRETFRDLTSISGDIGGRKIFSRYPVHFLPWLDPRLGLDVDSPEDYQRLIDAWKPT